MNWDRIIEQKIREAQEEGKFDNLAGYGKPLSLDENPYEDPAWQMANHLLKEGGFRPDWIDEDVTLREQLAQARTAARRTRAWCAVERAQATTATQRLAIEDEWQAAEARFRATLAKINKGIESLNLKVPHERFQRLKLDIETEWAKIVGEGL